MHGQACLLPAAEAFWKPAWVWQQQDIQDKNKRILHLTFSRTKLGLSSAFRRHDLQAYSQACISMFRSMPSFPSRDQWSMLWMLRGTGMCYNALDVRCTHPYMCAEDRKLGVLYCSWLTPLRQSLSLGLELVWQPAYPQRPSRLCPRQSKRHMRPCQAGKDSFFFIHIGHWSIC